MRTWGHGVVVFLALGCMARAAEPPEDEEGPPERYTQSKTLVVPPLPLAPPLKKAGVALPDLSLWLTPKDMPARGLIGTDEEGNPRDLSEEAAAEEAKLELIKKIFREHPNTEEALTCKLFIGIYYNASFDAGNIYRNCDEVSALIFREVAEQFPQTWQGQLALLELSGINTDNYYVKLRRYELARRSSFRALVECKEKHLATLWVGEGAIPRSEEGIRDELRQYRTRALIEAHELARAEKALPLVRDAARRAELAEELKRRRERVIWEPDPRAFRKSYWLRTTWAVLPKLNEHPRAHRIALEHFANVEEEADELRLSRAAVILAHLGSKEAVPLVRELVKSRNAEVVRNAATALGVLREPDGESLELLKGLAGHKDAGVMQAAVWGLGNRFGDGAAHAALEGIQPPAGASAELRLTLWESLILTGPAPAAGGPGAPAP